MKKIMTRLLSLVLLGAFIPSFVLAAEWDLKDGDITVNASDTAQTVSQAGSTPTVDNNPVITSNGNSTNNTVTITAEGDATANVTLENVNIKTNNGAAISTSGNVKIELDGTNTVKSGAGAAGLEKNNGGTLTITDENKDGSLTANGGSMGAGIGGGVLGAGTDITVTNDAQVKVQGGKRFSSNSDFGTGAGIGDGGNWKKQDGAELPQDPSKLNGGTIQSLIVSNPKSNTAETAVEVRQEAYWVCGSDGQALPYQSQVKDGVLTVTVQADTASLRGTTGSLRQLEAQGITEIRFVTNQAQSDFILSDLLTSGTGSVTLTHDGDKVTFTLESKDISGILK